MCIEQREPELVEAVHRLVHRRTGGAEGKLRQDSGRAKSKEHDNADEQLSLQISFHVIKKQPRGRSQLNLSSNNFHCSQTKFFC